MKRYLLFTYPSYYASGGWYDFVGSFSTIEEAKKEANLSEDNNEIVDTEDEKVILDYSKHDKKWRQRND